MKEAYEEIKRALRNGDNYVSTETLQYALEAFRMLDETASAMQEMQESLKRIDKGVDRIADKCLW